MGLDDDDLDFLEITDAKERAMLSGNAASAPAAAFRASCSLQSQLRQSQLLQNQPVVTLEEATMRKINGCQLRVYTSKRAI